MEQREGRVGEGPPRKGGSCSSDEQRGWWAKEGVASHTYIPFVILFMKPVFEVTRVWREGMARCVSCGYSSVLCAG